MSLNRLVGISAIIVVIGGLVAAFIFLGTPAHQRRITLDERRTGDLIRACYEINATEEGLIPQRFVAY